MKRLVVIDGNAIIHRGFHALPPLTTPDGTMVNAVYGFFSMFLKILEDLRPEYLIVCFDRATPTFRKQMYVGYQAKRPKMSDDLSPQIGKVHGVLDRAEITHIGIDGYEADDLIGTLAKKAVAEWGLSVVIVSGDRDLLQLVNGHVNVLAPITGLTNTVMFDSAKVKEKFGIMPSQMIDYKSLVGDSSDNYPGVSGIGPKTAVELLTKYHTLEGIYEHIGEIPEKVASKLAVDAEQAILCKKLATIVTDAPVSIDIKKARAADINKEELKEAFYDFGFASLLKRFGQEKSLEKEPLNVTKPIQKPLVKKQENKEQLELL